MCQNGCCRKILNALGQELLNNWGQTKKIHIKKADKGTTTVIMNKKDKIQEGQVPLDDRKKLHAPRNTNGWRNFIKETI